MIEFLYTYFFGMNVRYTVMAVDCYNGEYFTKNDNIRIARKNYKNQTIVEMIKSREFNDHHCEVIEVIIK